MNAYLRLVELETELVNLDITRREYLNAGCTDTYYFNVIQNHYDELSAQFDEACDFLFGSDSDAEIMTFWTADPLRTSADLFVKAYDLIEPEFIDNNPF